MFIDRYETSFMVSICYFFFFDPVDLTLLAVAFGPRLTSVTGCLWSTLCFLCKLPYECKKAILLPNLRELWNHTVW